MEIDINVLIQKNLLIEKLEEEVEKYKFLYSQQRQKVTYLREKVKKEKDEKKVTRRHDDNVLPGYILRRSGHCAKCGR